MSLALPGFLRGLGFMGRSRQANDRQRGSDCAPQGAAIQPGLVATPGRAADTPAKRMHDRRRLAARPPSFTEQLPYVDYSLDDKLFVLADGSTLGMMFELGAVPTEAQPAAYLAERASQVREVLQALPESDTSPWIAQFFVNDDRDISSLNGYLRRYIAQVHQDYPARRDEILGSPLTQTVLREFEAHLKQVSREQGLFVDTQVSGQVWRGQTRRVRCCLYKRFRDLSDDSATAFSQLEAVASTITDTLVEAGLSVRRCTGRDLYEWLLPFFNRKVPWATDAGELLEHLPYVGQVSSSRKVSGPDGEASQPGQAPILGLDFAELLNLQPPESDMHAGCFVFDGVPVKALTLQGLRTQPSIGHFTAERQNGHESFARFDRLPAGSMLSIAITVSPQHVLERHVEKIRDASRAKTAAAMETHAECEMVLQRMVQGDKLFPMLMTLYVTGQDTEALSANISQINALLVPSGLRFVEPRHDLVPLDGFLRGLPFNFDPAFDNKNLRRSRLTFASQIAALLPVYGRSRGTPHPGIWFWNRGGEPLWIDPLHKRDRKKNAHMLVLGPTGAGKSATLNYLAMLAMTIHKPRLVIADAGKSFALLLEFFREMGLSTYSVTLTSQADVALPPFLHARRLLDDKELMSSFAAAEQQARTNAGLPDDELMARFADLGSADAVDPRADTAADETDDPDEEDPADERRDYLGEMLITSVMMITGGEAQEVARMTRADRYLITRAIVRATVKCEAAARVHPLTHDVAIELMAMAGDASLSPARQARGEEMGQSMMTFTQGLRGKLFDREGHDWPDADVTLVEMGTLTQDGYGDALAVAYTSLIDSVQARGERYQDEDRPLIMLTDEGHLITTNELLGPKIAKGTKMWRKLNIWFWLATQNLKDFPDSMSRVLSMCEFWMLLTMDKSEIDEVARFRSLTPEQRKLMESARKEAPKYTEGVLISALGQMLFRNVPPALPIALAMTEGHEKAQRRRLMDQHGCSEIEAARMVARQLSESRS